MGDGPRKKQLLQRLLSMAPSALGALGWVVFAEGCGAGRPPVSEEDDTPAATMSLAGEEKKLGPKICEPLSQRDCRTNWVDNYRIKHCEPSVQYCRSDGFGWHGCGDLDAALRDPLPEDGGTEPDSEPDGAADLVR